MTTNFISTGTNNVQIDSLTQNVISINNTPICTTTSSGLNVNSGSLTVTPSSNQIILGNTRTITLTAPTPATDSRTYTIPDVGANTNFVLTDGSQTLNNTKTFSSGVPITATTNQLIFGTTNTTTINSVAPVSSQTLTIPDSGVASSNFVLTDGTQTINGSRTFSTAVSISPTTNQLILGTTNTTTINAIAPTASRNYTIPDTAANSSFVMTDSAQTVNGVKTFSSGIPITATSNQLVLSGTASFTYTITTTAPAASRVYSITDVGAAANFIMSAGNQTIAGTKTFSSAIAVTPTTNQLVLGTTRTATINAVQPATASRVYTVPDAGANANFVMSEAAATINGAKTFGSAITVTPTTNQLVLGTTRTATINAVTPATASRVYTVPDAGANANFIMSESAQTVNGSKVFSSALTVNYTQTARGSGLDAGNVVADRKVIVYQAGGVDNDHQYTGFGVRTGVFLFKINNVTADFVFEAATGTTASTEVARITGTGSIQLKNTSNQIIMGTTNTTTINSTAPTASRVHTIPDTGANANFLMSESSQTINGVKTFSSGVPISATTNQLVLGTTNTTTINSVAPAVSQAITIPDSGVSSTNFILQDSPTVQTINSNLNVGVNGFNPNYLSFAANKGSIGIFNDITNNWNGRLNIYGLGGDTLGAQLTVGTWGGFGTPVVSGYYLNDDTPYDTCITNGYGTGTPSIRFGFTNPKTDTILRILSNGITSSQPLTIKPTTNQLILGTTNTTTINSTAPTASQVLTIPDSGVSNSNFILSDGKTSIDVIGPSTSTPELGQVINGTLQLTSNNTPIVFGTNAPNVNRISRMVQWDYSGTNQYCGLVFNSPNSSTNSVSLGGGSGASSAATAVNVYAAANTTTATGSLISSFTTNGMTLSTGTLRLTGSDDKLVVGGTTANTTKTNRLLSSDYAGTGFWSFIFPFSSSASVNRLLIGGGSSSYNASTKIEFYAAANTTTTTGTMVASMDTTGLTVANQIICSASSNQLKLGNATINCTNNARTFTINDPYVSTGLVTNLIVSLTNTSTRPVVDTYANNNWNAWEIRGTSQTSTGNDDGFLRLRAGGASGGSASAAWIDVCGSSTVTDMNKTVVIGCGGEVARFASTGLTVTNLTATGTISGKVSATPVTGSLNWSGGGQSFSTNYTYTKVGNLVTLTLAGKLVASAFTSGVTYVQSTALPSEIVPGTSGGNPVGMFHCQYNSVSSGFVVYQLFTSTGNLAIYSDSNYGGWTTSHQLAFNKNTLTWNV